MDRRWKKLVSLGLGLISFLGAAASAQPLNSPAVQSLYEAAKKEGSVSVWGTNAREVEWIPKAFNAEFPGIEVKVLGDNDIATKAIAEARAGRNDLDVFWASLSLVMPLAQRDLLAKTDWAPFGVRPDNTTLDGRMAYTNNIIYVVAYNNKLVPAADVPQQWSDLLDARYRRKMVANQFLLPRMIGGLGMAWGDDKAIDYARELMAHSDIMLTRAPREPLLQSGERLYAVAEIDSWPRLWARDGLAIGYVIPQPVVTAQFGATVMAKAPHPNAARLMAGWLASQSGKQAREKAVLEFDYRPGSTHPEAQQLHAQGAKFVYDTVELVQRREDLIRKLNPIVSGQAR